jgi:hypothetical protein
MTFGRGCKGVGGVLGMQESMKRKGVVDVWAKSWVGKKTEDDKMCATRRLGWAFHENS